MKIDSKADKIRLSQCVTVTEDSFDKETFEDGHIYFLNTQKLSVTSKLTKNGDGRTYTIWQTLANTVPVSYTHLDVYKRQGPSCMEPGICIISYSTIRMMQLLIGRLFCHFSGTGVKS